MVVIINYTKTQKKLHNTQKKAPLHKASKLMKPNDGKEWEILNFRLFLHDLSRAREILYAFTYLTFKRWLACSFSQELYLESRTLAKLWVLCVCTSVHFFSGEKSRSY